MEQCLGGVVASSGGLRMLGERPRRSHFAGRRAVAVGGGVGEWNSASSVATGRRGAPGGSAWGVACMLALSASAGAFAWANGTGTSDSLKL